MAIHQTSRFSNNPIILHEKDLKRVEQYLLHTKRYDIIYNHNTQKKLECYVSADLPGGWQQSDSSNADNLMTQTGMVIMYANCFIYCHS